MPRSKKPDAKYTPPAPYDIHSICLQFVTIALLSGPLSGVGCPAAVDFVNRVIATLGAKSPRRNGDGKTQIDQRSHPVNRALPARLRGQPNQLSRDRSVELGCIERCSPSSTEACRSNPDA